MATRTSDFPFTIVDVVELLRLHVRRRSPDYIYADCPLCGSPRGKLCINLVKNAWCSNCCGDSGGMLALYAKAQNVSNAAAYSEICDALLNGEFVQVREAARQERAQHTAVEKIVLAILKKHAGENDAYPDQQTLLSKETVYLPQDLTPKEQEDSADELKALLGDEGFSAIANTLASFHQK